MKNYDYAATELEIIQKKLGDEYVLNDFIDEIKSLVNKFNNSGQSGGSAPDVANCLADTIKKLCLKEPLTELTGEIDEWEDVSHFFDKPTYQNKRCTACFKTCYDTHDEFTYLNAIVFKDQNNNDHFTGQVENINSRLIIKSFPFTPKTFYIDVVEIGGEYKIKDHTQLKEVAEYYIL